MRKLFIIACFFLLPLLDFAQNATLIIRNVSIIDVETGQIHKAQTVVIEGNKIVAVGRKVSTPKGALIVDATGKYLIPGLWDMHVHSLRRERIPLYFPQFLANGIIGIRDMSTPLEDFDLFKTAVSKTDTVLRPHFIKACGSSLDGKNNARPGLSIPIATPQQGTEAVDMLYNHGVDFIKVYSLLRCFFCYS